MGSAGVAVLEESRRSWGKMKLVEERLRCLGKLTKLSKDISERRASLVKLRGERVPRARSLPPWHPEAPWVHRKGGLRVGFTRAPQWARAW